MQLTTPNPLERRPEVSNSFSTVSHIYIPRFHTGQTLLKKNLSRQDCISVVSKLFVCRHRKPVEQISRHTSHTNLFPLKASNIIWRSPLLRATISGNDVMYPEMVLIFKKKVITSLAVTSNATRDL